MSITDQPGASLGIHKNGFTINLPRDMVLDFGLIPPTARERVDREREAAKWRAYVAAQKQADDNMLIELRGKTDPVTIAMLKLHSPTQVAYPECTGCDFSGYEGEPPEWPCRTIIATANAHGIATREDVKR